MLKIMNKLIPILALMLVSCMVKYASEEQSYDAELEQERIKKAEYEKMISAINFCINDRKHGHDPLVDDLITEDLLDDSSKVYCSDYTTTLEHNFVRYCRYFVYAEKNKSNVKSCYCDLITKRTKIRDDLKKKCRELANAHASDNQAIVLHLGEKKDFDAVCASLNNNPTSESIYDCD